MECDEGSLETRNALLEIKGEYIWFVRRSADQALRMDFGSPHLNIREPHPHNPERSQVVIDALERRMVAPEGKWHLFVFEAEWLVTTRFHTCKRSDTDNEKTDRALLQLEGQKLVDVSQTDGRSWLLSFDLGGSLHLTPPDLVESQRDDDSLWTLFYEDGNYVSYTNGGVLQDKRADLARHAAAGPLYPYEA